MPPSHDMNTFKQTLASAKHIVAVAGAGLSAASGIPTFRGAGGMWRKYDAISLATPEGFAENPSLVWQFYHFRRETALKAQPNAAHLALAAFSLPSIRHVTAPGSTFTLITQNVDGLSALALEKTLDLAPPSDSTTEDPLLLEMHGKLFDLVPGWFGLRKRPLHLHTIDSLVSRADLCLVVGTSSTVYPAAGYAGMVQRHGGTVAIFNLEHSAGDEDADYLFLGPCEETLPQALGFDTVV